MIASRRAGSGNPLHLSMPYSPLQAQVLCMSLMSPNQEVAVVVAAAYTCISCIAAGYAVPFPLISKAFAWIQYTSHMKYPFQVSQSGP